MKMKCALLVMQSNANGVFLHQWLIDQLVVHSDGAVFPSVSSAGILHGAGLWQLPKQLYLPTEEKSCRAPNSHLKYVW